MEDESDSGRSFFEPPEWWKKWRPLRWILAGLLLYWLYTLMPEPENRPAPVPAQSKPETPAAQPPAAATPTAPPAAPTPPAATREAPKPAAPEARAATAPTPVPAPAVEKPPVAEVKPVPAAPARPVEPAPAAPVAAVPAKPPEVQTPTVAPAPPKPLPPPPAAVTKAQPEPQKPASGEAMVDTLPGDSTSGVARSESAENPALAAYTAVAGDPVALINGLRSYANVQEVSEQLRTGGYTWKADQLSKPVRRTYPPYRTDTLTVENYRSLGQQGVLTLEFFNDRLYETNFSPVRADEYLRLLRKQGVPLKREESGRSELRQGMLYLETNIDFAATDVGRQLRTTPFIVWRDQRLMKQLREWGPLP